jgi:hypothetical protein
MGIKLTNNAFGTLAAGINSSATSITLTTGQGARFPTLSAGDYFYATLIDTSNNLEIVKCTARSTDVLTVTRAQENTTARSYSTGDRIEIRITAATFEEASAVADGEITAAKMAAGAAVGNLGFTPLRPSNNLSEITSASTARSNLGLAGLATRDTLVDAGTVSLSGNYPANTWNTLFNHSSYFGYGGTFIIRVYLDTHATGQHYQELYSGWYGTGNVGTNSNQSDTIYTHRGGHSPNAGTFSLRTTRQFGVSGGSFLVEFNTNETWTGLNGTSGRNVVWTVSRLTSA